MGQKPRCGIESESGVPLQGRNIRRPLRADDDDDDDYDRVTVSTDSRVGFRLPALAGIPRLQGAQIEAGFREPARGGRITNRRDSRGSYHIGPPHPSPRLRAERTTKRRDAAVQSASGHRVSRNMQLAQCRLASPEPARARESRHPSVPAAFTRGCNNPLRRVIAVSEMRVPVRE